ASSSIELSSRRPESNSPFGFPADEATLGRFFDQRRLDAFKAFSFLRESVLFVLSIGLIGSVNQSFDGQDWATKGLRSATQVKGWVAPPGVGWSSRQLPRQVKPSPRASTRSCGRYRATGRPEQRSGPSGAKVAMISSPPGDRLA